jgi:hypothetical protein
LRAEENAEDEIREGVGKEPVPNFPGWRADNLIAVIGR